jgi:hypothetical protein
MPDNDTVHQGGRQKWILSGDLFILRALSARQMDVINLITTRL